MIIIIDLGWPSKSLTTSTVDYSSDSWVFCFSSEWSSFHTLLVPMSKFITDTVFNCRLVGRKVLFRCQWFNAQVSWMKIKAVLTMVLSPAATMQLSCIKRGKNRACRLLVNGYVAEIAWLPGARLNRLYIITPIVVALALLSFYLSRFISFLRFETFVAAQESNCLK